MAHGTKPNGVLIVLYHADVYILTEGKIRSVILSLHELKVVDWATEWTVEVRLHVCHVIIWAL